MDMMDKSKEDRGVFERISLYIPGYKGYREKDIRRDVDRQVRSYVAMSIKEVKTVMADLKRQVLENGDIASVKSMERIATKIDTYMKTIESSESGYSGIWETLKTNETDLDAIVEWDERLLDGSAGLKNMLMEFRDIVDGGETDIKPCIRDLEKHVDDLRDGLNERKYVLKGLCEGDASDETEEAGEPEAPEAEPVKKKRGLFGFGRK